MTRHYSIPVWVDEICETAESEFDHFTPNTQYRDAVTEILRELQDIAGYSAVDDLCEAVITNMEEYRRHPKSARIRDHARSIAAEELDGDLPITSPLLKSRNG